MTNQESIKVLTDLIKSLRAGKIEMLNIKICRGTVRVYEDERDGIKHFESADDFFVELHMVNK